MRASPHRPIVVIVLLLGLALSASAGSYTVQWGDTLGGIAHKLGVSVGDLSSANGITDPNRIRAGQVLTVPVNVANARPIVAASVVRSVRVGHGDTLSAIAHRYGTTVAAVAKANGLTDVDHIREGAELELPVAAAAVNWVCPVYGPVHYVGHFGDPRGGRVHQGVDVAAPRGTPVVANVAGVVEHHPNARGGNAYYLHGDDGDVYYGAHLDSYVGAGGRVAMGQQIGRVGDSGNASGGITHLHFERMPHGGPSVDPMPLLARACFGS